MLHPMTFTRRIYMACWLCLASLGVAQAGVLTGTVADYNAAKVATAGGVLTVPASVMVYTADLPIPNASQLVVTLPYGFTFTSTPILASSRGGVSLTLSSGGTGNRSATYTTSGGAMAAADTISFGASFTVAGANGLHTVTPVANAMQMSWQVIGVDPAPLSRGAFASDYGIAAIFVGAIQFVDISPPSYGTMWLSSPDTRTAVTSAIALQTQTLDTATSSVPILNPDGTANSINAGDQAYVTQTAVFQGVGSVFTSSTSDCRSPLSQAVSLGPNSATVQVPVNVEVFFCATGSGQPLGVSNPNGGSGGFGGGLPWFTNVSVSSAGSSTDFVAGAPANIQYAGTTCAVVGPSSSTCVPWSPNSVATIIPPLTGLPPVPGIGTQPPAVDLSANPGPAMTACLLATVRSLFGNDAVYVGQNANGGAKFSQGGGIISFYPLQGVTTASSGANLVLNASNLLTVGTSCGNFTVAPALSSLTDFGALMSTLGWQANIDAQGVLTVIVGNTVYAFRPDYLVSSGTRGAPLLTLGADGLYRFTDSAGNVQILRPAFVDIADLGSQVQSSLSLNGTLRIQTDGTALLTTFGGQQYVLTPDLNLTAVPAANAAMLWWTDAPNHYLVRSSLLTLAQGFTLRQTK